MNCKHCNDIGWVCEKHPDKPNGHDLTIYYDEEKHFPTGSLVCTEAGMPCDKCDAFPHKKKPREFWISCDELIYGVWTQERKGAIHVREVVEISEKELNEQAEKWTNENQPISPFGLYRAGILWAIKKMRGD